jgi:hypothetical protein
MLPGMKLPGMTQREAENVPAIWSAPKVRSNVPTSCVEETDVIVTVPGLGNRGNAPS